MNSDLTFIRGERIFLRPPEKSDVPIFAKWFNSPETRDNLALRKPISLDKEEKIVARLNDNDNVFLVICESSSGRAIGNLSIKVSWINRRGLFGIIIGEKKDQNKGYGKEAMTLFFNYCFDVLNLHRIVLEVYSFNERAIHLYKKLGFVHEGTFRQHSYKLGEYHDLFYMGLLDHEWKAIRDQLK